MVAQHLEELTTKKKKLDGLTIPATSPFQTSQQRLALILTYRNHRHISRTFLLKIFAYQIRDAAYLQEHLYTMP